MLASGFLLHEGAFELIPLFLALAFGELTWDVGWYFVGYFYADRFIARSGRYFSVTPVVFDRIKSLFAKYHAVTLLGNKLLMGLGLGIAVLITGGATKVSFWKYMFVNAVGEVIWVSAMLYIGYSYADLLVKVTESLKITFLVGTILVAVLLGFGISKYARRKVLKQ